MTPDRIKRIIRLLGLLQGGRAHNARSLGEMCGVTRRTIFRDLEALRAADVPLVYDEARQIYSIPAEYFLAPTQFTTEEALALVVICHELGDVQRLPFLADARSAVVKIENTFPQAMRERLRRVADAIRIRLGTITPMENCREQFQTLVAALLERRCVRIEYRGAVDPEPVSTKLSPYRLLFHQHGWYAVGRSSIHAAVRTFHLVRVSKFELLEETYQIPSGFDLERHFGNSWRMIPGVGPDFHVRIRFRPLVAKNVAEVSWHKTQQVSFLADGSLEFTAQVSGLSEIVWWILGYGDQAEVLEPPELRRAIAERVRNLAAIYAAEPPDET